MYYDISIKGLETKEVFDKFDTNKTPLEVLKETYPDYQIQPCERENANASVIYYVSLSSGIKSAYFNVKKLVHYSGELGDFVYDADEFEFVSSSENGVQKQYLHYKNIYADGSLVNIPKGINNCYKMFYQSNLLTPPIIPDGVTHCNYMFYDCNFLIEPPKIPDGVLSCEYMFYRCRMLQKAPRIPKSAKLLKSMFNCCTSLQEIPQMEENDFRRCDFMFEGCSNILKVDNLPNNIKSAAGMFSGCSNLVSVNYIPNTIIYADNMFQFCSKLKHLTSMSYKAVTLSEAYDGCVKLEKIPSIPKEILQYNHMLGTTKSTAPICALKMFNGAIYTKQKISIETVFMNYVSPNGFASLPDLY